MTTDYLIIGAGVIGMAIARELKSKYPDRQVVILEKEKEVALHSSGRNSGVLHAGFYYTADSLKARFTREGNAYMRQYCKDNGLKINECGKLVVTQNEEELKSLYELEKRGKANGVDIKLIPEEEVKKYDPNVKTYKFALWSPTTSTVDPVEICLCMKKELISKGVLFFFEDGYKRRIEDNRVETESGKEFTARVRLINTAGLYADRVARDFGFSKNYVIIPFKGIYLKYILTDMPIKTNVYPVPNLGNPFLGVHYTVTVDEHIKIGPTSIPAFWRENYKGLSNFKMGELFTILGWEAKLFLLNSFKFRTLALEEIRKYNRKYFYGLASKMVKHIEASGFQEWTRPGLRAQLLRKETKELVMDFVIEADDKSIHVLNAVSPAFTASKPFAAWVVEKYA
ncbi:MAG: L-2-hydroxyglutarate oxidase [Bacteroidales bacterium]